MRIAAVDVELISLPPVTPPFAWRRVSTVRPRPERPRCSGSPRRTGAVGEAYHEWSGVMLEDIVDRVLREELVGQLPTGASGCGTGSGSSTGPRSSRSGSSASSTWHCGTSKGACWASRCTPARDVPRVDPRLRVDGHVLHHRGVPRRRRPVPRARLSGDQASRLGRRPGRRRPVPALREHVGPDVDLMYDGSAGFDLPTRSSSATRSPRPATSGTRSRCASSA